MWRSSVIFLFLLFLAGLSLGQLDTIIELEDIEIKPVVKYEQKLGLDHSSLNLAQVLSDKSPVFIKDYGTGNLATLSYQGTTSSQTSLYWNDINLNPINSGTIDYSLVDSYLFSSVKLSTSENKQQGSGIGANVSLNNDELVNDGFSISTLLKAGSFNDFNSGVKMGFKDSLNEFRLSLYGGAEKNDFNFYNPVLKEYQDQVNNRNDHFSGLVQYKRTLKNSQFYVKSWNRISKREIPSPVHVGNQEETQDDLFSRTVVGYDAYGKSYWLKSHLAFLTESYRYENPVAGIIGGGKINRVQPKITLGKADAGYSVELVSFGDFQKAEISGGGQERNILGGALAGEYKIWKSVSLSASLRKEFYLLEEGLPLLWDAKLSHKARNFVSYVSFQKNARKPTLNDLYWPSGGNLDLSHEVSKTGYLGLRMNKIVNLKAELFYGDVGKMIIWLPDSESGSWTPVNEAYVKRSGVTLDLNKSMSKKHLKVTPGLVWAFTSSLTDDEKQLIYTPKQQLKWRADIEYKKYFIYYSGQLVSKSYVTRDMSNYLPHYTVSNLEVGKFWGKEKIIKTSIESRNLFDYTYYLIPFRALPGRYLGVRIELL